VTGFHSAGYGAPPRSGRFKPGQSGNPKGRPKGSKKTLPYEAVFSRMVTIIEDGVERQVTVEEAFLRMLMRDGLTGQDRDTIELLNLLDQMSFEDQAARRTDTIIIKYGGVGSVTCAIERLRIARKLNRFKDTITIKLEPWAVERALSRVPERRFTLDEQRTIVAATRTPDKVKWPIWWDIRKR